MRCEVVPARLTHVGWLASNMREEDRRECRALGRTPKDALRTGLRCSLSAFTAIDETGKPVAMFGVVPVSLLSRLGRVWFLGSDHVFRYSRQLREQGPGIIEDWFGTFERLENIVTADNHKAIRLLKHWGFAVGGKPEMHGGAQFLSFWIERAGSGSASRDGSADPALPLPRTTALAV